MAEVGLLSFARVAMETARVVLPLYRSRYSKPQFTQPPLRAILCLMRYADGTFREAEVRLAEHRELRGRWVDRVYRTTRPCIAFSSGWGTSRGCGQRWLGTLPGMTARRCPCGWVSSRVVLSYAVSAERRTRSRRDR